MSKTRVEVDYDYSRLTAKSYPSKNNYITRTKVSLRESTENLDLPQPVTTSEKLLCSSCYATFGLSGLLSIILSFASGKIIANCTYFHTIQGLGLGVFVAATLAVLSALNFICSMLVTMLTSFQQAYYSVSPAFSGIVFCIILSFAILVLLGKKVTLPGISIIARRIMNK